MEKSKREKRWILLIVGLLGTLSTGIIYAWSIFKAPLAAEFNWDGPALSLNFTLTMSATCIGGIVLGFLLKKFRPGQILFVAGIMIALGFILTSRNQGNLSLLYFSYAGLSGLGIGIAYTLIISCVNSWFPDRKGLSSGVLMMGFGMSTLVIGNIAGSLFQLPSFGWRRTFFLLGIYIAAVLILEAFIIRFPTKEELEPYLANSPSGVRGGIDIETKDMLRTSRYWMYFLYTICITAVGSTVISFARDLCLSVGAASALANLLVGFLSVFNGIGRVIFGLFFDRKGLKKTMGLAGTITVAAPAITLVAIFIGSIPLAVLGLCLTGVSYSSGPTVTSTFIASQFGQKYFPMNFSITNLSLLVASMIAPVAANLYAEHQSFVQPYLLLLGLAAAGFILSILIQCQLDNPVKKQTA